MYYCTNTIIQENLEIFCKPDSSILTDDPTIEIYTSTGSEIEMSKNILKTVKQLSTVKEVKFEEWSTYLTLSDK